MVKNNKINEYKYIVAVIGGSILIAIILIAAVGRPLYASLKKTNAELDEKRLVLEKLETNLTNLKSLDGRKAEIEEKNQKVLSALPQDKDVPRLFIQMEKIASTAGFSIQTVSESTSTDIGTTTDSTSVQNPGQINPHYYTVSGTVRDYSSLKDALTRIESGLRLISVEKIDIQGGQSGSGLSVTITAKTYSRGE